MTDFIEVFADLIPQDTCQELIRIFDSSNDTRPNTYVDASGADVPNIFLVELSAVSADESPKSVEGAAVEVLQLADKLSAYIDLNSVDENLATALRPGLPGGYGFR